MTDHGIEACVPDCFDEAEGVTVAARDEYLRQLNGATLIARLRAAEKAVRIARQVELGTNGISWKYFHSAWQAWQKVAGYDGRE